MPAAGAFSLLITAPDKGFNQKLPAVSDVYFNSYILIFE